MLLFHGAAERNSLSQVGLLRTPPHHPMKNIIGIILIALGIFLFVQGLNRQDSVAGAAASVGTDVANAVDGGARQPKHVMYMVGGGILAIIGVAVMVRKPRAI